MNVSGDIPLTHSSTPDNKLPCSIALLIPSIRMSSCRGRAEAFARSLSSKLRTLGTQGNEVVLKAEDDPIINGKNTNTWVNSHEANQTVTDLQPLRNESDSFFDFDCELESPGSPVDECEYLRLIETASNTPHNSTAESGYACASAASSHSSADCPYLDAEPDSSISSNNVQKELQITLQPQPKSSQNSATEQEELVSKFVSERNGKQHLLTNVNNTVEQQKEDGKAKQFIKLKQTRNSQDETLLQAKILSELQQQSDIIKSSDEILCLNQEGNELEEHSPTMLNRHIDQLEEKLLHLEDERILPVVSIKQLEQEQTAPKIGTDDVDNCAGRTSDLNKNEALAKLEQANHIIPETILFGEKTSHIHGIDTTDDEDDCRPQRVRRCSSLKTGKTPPGTPGRKKIVRFADVLGLDLADIKTFLDEIPTIPKSAFEDLEVIESEPPLQLGPRSDKLLMPLFQQPGGLPSFLDAVREKQVSLENAAVTDIINQTISGSVRVRNLDFHKSVHVRYTLDGWRSFADLQANYVENSCDGFSDKFTFVLFGNSLHVGQRLEFAVRFQCKGQQFWDSNYGANYCFQCLPNSNSNHAASLPSVASGSVQTHHANNITEMLSPTAGDAWCSSFY